jgi:phosphoribosyl 1,2-cyclic phosphodiesterase
VAVERPLPHLTLRFWGTRGSIPSPGALTVRYGGNTPCIEVRTADNWLIILDAGTGIRDLGRALLHEANGAPISGDIYLTHAHWDHIQGLPFFAPVFHEKNHFTIWGSKAMETSIGRVLRDQMSPVVFPVTFDQLAATIEVRELVQQTRGHGYHVRAFPVRHPGGALGYRLTTGNGNPALVYISDNELNPGAPYESSASWRRDMVDFCRNASILIHDTMYTSEEYKAHSGWGHSTPADAVDLALEAGVDRLVLFHHKPERTDDEVDRLTDECRALVAERGGTLKVLAAAEGMMLVV